MKLKILAMALVVVMLVSACGQAAPADTSGTTPATLEGDSATPASGGTEGTDAVTVDNEREPYTFKMWYSYDWYVINPWAEDAVSRHWAEKFNITMEQGRPDSIGNEVLNLMIAADDLPDVIWMERDAQNIKMAKMGLFVPINDLKAKVDNNWYDENISEVTQKLYEIDGKNYIIPNWPRQGKNGQKGVTGGNMAWMVTTNVWDALGQPEFNTWDDLYNYAVAIRDSGLTNAAGAPIIPFLFNTHGNYGVEFLYRAAYRNHGGAAVEGNWWSILEDGSFGSVFRVPNWRETVLEINRWYRDGLIPESNFTNSADQFLENLTNGRGGLIFYDHSQDTGNSFRRILRENDPGNSIEVVTVPGTTFLHPPAGGRDAADIYHDNHGTMGWNGSFITTRAEKPERIFEFLSWLLTPMGSIEMALGPQGELWDELDADGNPILTTAPATLTAEETRELGTWLWTIAGHSDHVDKAKFAANSALPEDQRNWVETMQQTIFTENMFISDEFAGIMQIIDPTSDLGIQFTLITNEIQSVFPQMLMAPSAEEAERLYDELLTFMEANGVAEIEKAMNDAYQINLEQQGGSVFRTPGSW